METGRLDSAKSNGVELSGLIPSQKEYFIPARAMVLEGMFVAGVPAKIKRPLTKEEKHFLRQLAANYVCYRDNYQS